MKQKPRSSVHLSDEELQGTIERVRFTSSENGWSVLDVRIGDRTCATVVGLAPRATAGEAIRCHGRWKSDSRFGRQFAATQIVAIPPVTESAIERYLASGAIAGVGDTYAKRLVATFGTRLPEVIAHSPGHLESVEGIGPKRRERIANSWQRNRDANDAKMFLHQHGLGASRADQVFRLYGRNTINQLRSNPYRLADDIQGVGFNTADEIAQRAGIGAEDPKRIEAGLRETVHRQTLQGHCAVPQNLLVKQTSSLLKVEGDLIAERLAVQIDGRRLVCEELDGQSLIYTPRLYAAEIGVASHVERLRNGVPPWRRVAFEPALAMAEQQTGKRLASSQYDALKSLLSNKVSIVTGNAGTGKTTLMHAFLAALNQRIHRFALCAPTAHAARQLARVTGQEVTTIHRLLGGSVSGRGFLHNADSPLDAQLLLVDEVSMVDLELMHALLEATPDDCAVVLAGDVDQLSSIGPGQVLADLIESGVLSTVRLTEPQRQAKDSAIIRNAHRINRRLPPLIDNDPAGDFQWIVENDAKAIPARLADIVARELPQRGFHPLRDIQVLAPMRRCDIGTIALNQRLQQLLNPEPAQRLPFERFSFGVGDRVVQLTNNYPRQVLNGNTGFLERIHFARKMLTVNFDDRQIPYSFGDLDELALAYAMTVHKAQGSEYPAVVIPLAVEHYPLLYKRLLYTAVTRGKQRVVLLGQERAMQIALSSARSDQRVTGLRQRLQRLVT